MIVLCKEFGSFGILIFILVVLGLVSCWVCDGDVKRIVVMGIRMGIW